MANKLYINGQDVTNNVEGLGELSIRVEKNTSTKVVGREMSSDLSGDGFVFQTLNERLTNCDFDFTIPCRFKTPICGGITIDSHITSDNITLDPCACTAKFDLLTQSRELKAFRYLDSIAWKQYFVTDYDFPLVWYCDQPGFLQVVCLALFTLIKFVLVPINVILNIINNVVCLFGLLCDTDDVDLNPIDNLYAVVDNWITGCGRSNPSPYLRDVLEYHAQAAGLTFKSSIYQNPDSPYYNEVIFNLEAGEYLTDDQLVNTERIIEVFEANTPVQTVLELLESLKDKFYADYCIKDGQLIFEHNSIINNPKRFPTVVTKDQLCSGDDGLDYSFDVKEAFAFADFQYTRDGYDTEGNSVLHRFYKEIEEYNNPPSPRLKGRQVVNIQYGAARFMYDEVTCKGGFLSTDRYLDDFRDGTSGFFEFLGFGNQGIKRHVDLILTASRLSIPKLLILEPDTDLKDARTVRKQGEIFEEIIYIPINGTPFPTTVSRQCWYYNYPNYFDSALQDYLGEPDLIERFHLGRNPHTRKDHISLGSFTQECDCSVVEVILANNTDVTLATHYGDGVPASIDIEFKQRQVLVTYNDITVHCD